MFGTGVDHEPGVSSTPSGFAFHSRLQGDGREGELPDFDPRGERSDEDHLSVRENFLRSKPERALARWLVFDQGGLDLAAARRRFLILTLFC